MKRTLRTAALTGAGLVLAGGAAMAASATLHKIDVAMPDGSIAQIEYAGDVAPKVIVQPAAQAAMGQDAAFGDPAFADFDRISAMMDRQQQAMMQQAAAMQAAAAQAAAHAGQANAQAGSQPGMVTVSTNMPAGQVRGGSYHYEFVSTTSGNGTCAQTVSWSSDGSSAQPKMTQTSSGDCDAAKSAKSATVPVSAPAPQQRQDAALAGTNKV